MTHTTDTTATYTVQGMTCGHCVAAVSGEIGGIPGVTKVDVELSSGVVTVTSTEPVPRESIVAALDEAGYELVS